MNEESLHIEPGLRWYAIQTKANREKEVEKRLSDLQFQFADGLTDGRLRAKELLGGAREAALAGHGEEDFELGKVHKRQFSGPGSQFSEDDQHMW